MRSEKQEVRGRRRGRRGAAKILAAVFIAAGMGAAFSCQRQSPGPVPGTLRYNIMSEPPTLDWSIATDHASIQVLLNIMEGLTRFDEDLRPQPALAESWEVLEEGRRYVFHLRPQARWTDGRAVTAQDFVYSWQRLLAPETGAEYAYFLYPVKNAEAFNTGRIKEPAAVGVKARDDRTLEVELERPVVFFPMLTAFVSTFPLRQDVVERYGDIWTEPGNIVTCGPYRLVEWRHEYRITLVRNEDYYAGRPGLDRIVFYMVNEESTALSLYLTGRLDVVDPLPAPAIPAYQSSPEYRSYPYFAIYYYGFNTRKPPVNDPRVRAALAHTIDRSELPRILQGGQIPWSTVLPYGLPGANPRPGREFNPQRARELLAEAGYSDPAKMPVITIGYNTLESHKMIAEFIQQQWTEHLGIRVVLRNMEWKVYLKELQHDPPQVWRLGWILDYPDPDSIMSVFLSESGNNHTRWHSEEYDRLVKTAALESDPVRRQELYDRAQETLCFRDVPIIPLYSYTKNILIRPWVKNFPRNGQALLYLHQTYIASGGEE